MWNETKHAAFKVAIDTYDAEAVDRLCEDLIGSIATEGQVIPEVEAIRVLDLLIRRQLASLARRLADALILAGQASGAVRQRYAQSLIDGGDFSAGIDILEHLAANSANDRSGAATAQAAIARALTRRYLDDPLRTPARARLLARAARLYQQLHAADASEAPSYRLAAAAVASRARRDDVALEPPIDSDAIAREVLAAVLKPTREGVPHPDPATAAEACVALRRWPEACEWLRQYVADQQVDATALSGMLLQLRELWGLANHGEQGELLAVIEAALLQRQGGAISLGAEGPERLAEDQDPRGLVFERVFGREGPVTFQWYVNGISRARAVGRVEDRLARAVGTGFVIRGADFFTSARPDDLLFMTNAHVLGELDARALRPSDAVICFEAHVTTGVPSQTRFQVREVVWESPKGELDASIVCLESVPAGVTPFPMAPPEEPEFIEGVDRRLYIIGHPLGGSLTLSIQDNTQVGWGKPFLHYRTPTRPGSSGSPVFDDQWRLIALHHAGLDRMRRLDGHPGSYQANEGIWIHAIAERTRASRVQFRSPITTADATVATLSERAAAVARQGVLISYCQKDRSYLGELQKVLKPLSRNYGLRLWSDADVRIGANWREELKRAIATCRVAVLLVTADYLDSDAIQEGEFRQLVETAATGEVTLFWIAVGHAMTEVTPLADLRAANDPDHPLNGLSGSDRERAWVDIARQIHEAAGSGTKGVARPSAAGAPEGAARSADPGAAERAGLNVRSGGNTNIIQAETIRAEGDMTFDFSSRRKG